MHLQRRWHAQVALLLGLWACSQAEPFTNPDYREPTAFDPTPPVRLTYNPGPDVEPAFLPGSEIVFGFSRPGEPNEDQCLGALPNQGGTTLAESCPRTAASRDSTERYGEARALTADTVALVVATRRAGRRTDDFAWIGRAPWRSATEFTPRLRFPFPSATGLMHFTPRYLSVVAPNVVAYVATRPETACPGTTYPCDGQVLVTFGTEVGQVNLGDSAPPVVLSGIRLPTSIAPGPAPGSILFTLVADVQVYQRDAAGTITVFASPGASTAVRDPSLAGNLLVSVVDGPLSFYTLPDSSLVQDDVGGDLMLTDLDTGQSRLLARGFWRRPYLSADGRQVVAEGDGDIYRFDLP